MKKVQKIKVMPRPMNEYEKASLKKFNEKLEASFRFNK